MGLHALRCSTNFRTSLLTILIRGQARAAALLSAALTHTCKGFRGPACSWHKPVSKRACCRKEEQWDGRVWKRKQPKWKLPNSTSNSRIVHQLWQQVLSPMCVMAEWNGYPNETITSVPNIDLRKWNLKLILQAAPVQCWRQMLARSLWRTRLTIPMAKMAAKRQQGKAKGWGIFILQTSKMSGRRKKVFQFYLIIEN